MSAACDLELMEALAFEELPLDQARRALEHAGACGPCGLELAALRRERATFHARAAAQPALPRLELFARVQAQAQARGRKRRVRREVAAFVLCAASLLCVVGLSARSAREVSPLSPLTASAVSMEPCASSEEPGYSVACGGLDGMRRVASVDEISLLDAEVGACLVATPARCR